TACALFARHPVSSLQHFQMNKPVLLVLDLKKISFSCSQRSCNFRHESFASDLYLGSVFWKQLHYFPLDYLPIRKRQGIFCIHSESSTNNSSNHHHPSSYRMFRH